MAKTLRRLDGVRQSLLLAAWLILLTGCGGTRWVGPASPDPYPGHIYVCLDLPAAQLPAAHQAVQMWDHAIGGWEHVVAVNGGKPWKDACNIWVHVVDGPLVAPTAAAQTNHVGGNEIELRKRWYEMDITGILLHELGHAMGAQHMVGTLMTPDWKKYAFRCPDATTVAQVAAWHQVVLDQMAWCDQ